MSATLTTLAAVSTRIQYTRADLPQYGHGGELLAPRDLARFEAPQAKILLPCVAKGDLIQRQVVRLYDLPECHCDQVFAREPDSLVSPGSRGSGLRPR